MKKTPKFLYGFLDDEQFTFLGKIPSLTGVKKFKLNSNTYPKIYVAFIELDFLFFAHGFDFELKTSSFVFKGFKKESCAYQSLIAYFDKSTDNVIDCNVVQYGCVGEVVNI